MLYLVKYKGKLCHIHQPDEIFELSAKLTDNGGSVRRRLAGTPSLASRASADANTMHKCNFMNHQMSVHRWPGLLKVAGP